MPGRVSGRNPLLPARVCSTGSINVIRQCNASSIRKRQRRFRRTGFDLRRSRPNTVPALPLKRVGLPLRHQIHASVSLSPSTFARHEVIRARF
ncbi:hypothetical protein SUGI_0137030 [Cryptomeria japonica]|nr:hypothetical protein SUGI_0137030 [Cryptomeria japonica]